MMSNSPWDQGHHPGAPAPGGTVYYQDPNLQGHEAPIPLSPGQHAVPGDYRRETTTTMYSDDGIIPTTHYIPPPPTSPPPMSPTTHLPPYSENYSNAEKAHGVYIPPAVPTDPNQPAFEYPQANIDADVAKKRKRKRLIWILVGILAFLIIVGAVLGGVFGSGVIKKKSDSDSSGNNAVTNTTSPAPAGPTFVAKRIGFHAATLDGATANTLFYSSDSEGNIIYRLLDHGKAADNPTRSKPQIIYNVSTPNILLDRKPLKNSPLAVCELSTGLLMFYINNNLQLDAIFTVNGTGGWFTVDINYLLNIKAESDLAAFELYKPSQFGNATEGCGLFYQHPTTNRIQYNTAILTFLGPTQDATLTFHNNTSYDIPLVSKGQGDYAPLPGTSILGLPTWVSLNGNSTSANPNGVHRVVYQTTGGKIVASVFEPDKTAAALRTSISLLQEEEIGIAVKGTPLTMSAAATKATSYGFVTEGDYTIYALSKPNEVTSWYADSVNPRASSFIKWIPGPKLDYNLDRAIAKLSNDRYTARKIYVASDGLVNLFQYDQVTLKGNRTWVQVAHMEL